MKPITRRGLIAGLGAVTALAQEAAKSGPATIEDDLKSARELMRDNIGKLAAVKLPVATEPAFVFKA
jgi:hypothetical protein